MSGFLGGGMTDPIAMGLMGLAQGFGNAAMPSRMPIPLGAAFGSAAGGLNDAMMNAQKLKLLAQQEQRLNQQNEIQRDQWNSAKPLMANLPGLLGQTPAGLGGGSVAPEDVAPSPQPMQAPAAPPANAQEFIQRYTPHALAVAQETGLDPRLVLAQAGLESAWGTKAPGNNLFGIKGPGQTLATQESVNGQMVPQQASFRAYDSPDKSFQDYAAFIKGNPRYQSVMGAQGLEGQIDAMGRSGYATDPNYAGKLRMLARGIQIPEGAQPAAMAGGGQPSASADMGASPAANLTPTQMKAFNGVANKSFQQYSQLVNTAAAMTMNPFTKDMAPILMQHANKFLEVGSWQVQQDPATGRKMLVNVINGDVKAHPLDEQFTLSPGQSRFGANGKAVASLPLSPGTPTQRFNPKTGKVEWFDPNNPDGPGFGQPLLKPDEIQALPFQPGAQQQAPATPAAPGATTTVQPAPTATSQADAFNASMARRTGEEAFQREQGQTVAKTTGELMAQRNTAYDNLRKYDQFGAMMKDFETGRLAEAKITVGQLLQQFKIPDALIPAGIDRKSIASAETMKSITNNIAMGMIGPGGMPANNFSEADRQFVVSTVNNLMNTPGGNVKIMELAKAVEQRKLAIGNGWAEWRAKNGDSVASYQQFEAAEIPKLKAATPMPAVDTGQAQTTAPQYNEGDILRQMGPDGKPREYIVRNGKVVPK